ncbi:MAG: hypothetical protein IKX68_05995 [Clostridiales bacterium]|nr:hypothetical protein [Clostridiales bacterium]
MIDSVDDNKEEKMNDRKLKIVFVIVFVVLTLLVDALCIVCLTKDGGVAIRCNKALVKDTKEVLLTSLEIDADVQKQLDEIDRENAKAKERIVESYGSDTPIIITIVAALDIMIIGIGFHLYFIAKSTLRQEKMKAAILSSGLILFLVASGLVCYWMHSAISHSEYEVHVGEEIVLIDNR